MFVCVCEHVWGVKHYTPSAVLTALALDAALQNNGVEMGRLHSIVPFVPPAGRDLKRITTSLNHLSQICQLIPGHQELIFEFISI